MTDTIPTAETAKIENTHSSRNVRRMLGFGLDWWNTVMLLSLGAGALAAFAIVFSTAVVVKMQKQEAIDAANEFARYRLEAGKEIAEAKARGAEAELKLAEYRNPRAPIIEEHSAEFVAAIVSFKGTKFDMGHAPVGREQWNFAWYLEPLMSQAGWEFMEWSTGNNFPKVNWTGKPHLYGVANVGNVSVELDPDSRAQLLPAATALVDAFKSVGIDAAVTGSNNGSPNKNIIHSLIGQKE